MEIAESKENGITILRPSGEIDLHASPALRAKLHELIDEKASAVLIDFSAVRYIDSSGLATLIEYIRDSKGIESKFALCALQPKVKMVFELVRLNELFTITGSKEEALAVLSPD